MRDGFDVILVATFIVCAALWPVATLLLAASFIFTMHLASFIGGDDDQGPNP